MRDSIMFAKKSCFFAILSRFICTVPIFFLPLHPLSSKMGKSCTASSLRILQDGNVAKVVGCSGAM